MIENNFISDLIDVGLTNSESKVYFYLLKKKNFTATEISKLAQVPQSKVYDVLSKLVQKGLCTETLGKVKKYSPVNPKVGFDNLFKELEEKKKRVSDLSESLLPLYLSEKENTDPLDYIQVLREKNRIAEKVEYLERIAKEEVLAFDKPPYAIPKINEEEFRGLERGVKYKAVYEITEAKKFDSMTQMKMYMESGEEIRVAYDLPMKMMIFDGKIVIFALRDRITSKPSLTSMVIEHPDIIKAFKITFYSIWEKAMTFKEFMIKSKGSTFGREKV